MVENGHSYIYGEIILDSIKLVDPCAAEESSSRIFIITGAIIDPKCVLARMSLVSLLPDSRMTFKIKCLTIVENTRIEWNDTYSRNIRLIIDFVNKQ